MLKIELTKEIVDQIRAGLSQQGSADQPTILIPDYLVLRLSTIISEQIELGGLDRDIKLAFISAIAIHMAPGTSDYGKAEVFRKGGLTPLQCQCVANCIENQLAEELQVKDLAQLVGLSSNYFGQAFLHSFGVTPHRYILERRIERAKSLLLQNTVSIAKIAVAVGFASQSHFTQHFRKIAGITPAIFRRTLQRE